MSSKTLKRAVCQIAVSKLLCKVFQLRRKQVGNFLATCRSIKRMQIVSEANFGIGLHYKSNKPILYDSAYRLWPRNMPLPVNGDGALYPEQRCFLHCNYFSVWSNWERAMLVQEP